eukprot:6177599-Pleurochrysis_carterae.AAC.2
MSQNGEIQAISPRSPCSPRHISRSLAQPHTISRNLAPAVIRTAPQRNARARGNPRGASARTPVEQFGRACIKMPSELHAARGFSFT